MKPIIGIVIALVLPVISFSQPSIPAEVQKQIEDDLQKCGSKTREVRCAVTGTDDWIFLQESLVNLTVGWKDNSKAFLAFNDSLRNRGIALVVVPVPDKFQVAAGHYSAEFSGGIVAPQYEKWVRSLRDRGIVVIDAMDAFLKQDKTTPMFEAYESHCTDEARRILARMVAGAINRMNLDLPRKRWVLQDTVVPGTGNLFHLKYDRNLEYDVHVQKVVDEKGKKYQSSKSAPVIVIGDSNADFGWNSSSNIGAYIAHMTGIETFTHSKIGGGNAGATIFKGRDNFLKGKKVVVWVFDGRELYGVFKMPEF